MFRVFLDFTWFHWIRCFCRQERIGIDHQGWAFCSGDTYQRAGVRSAYNLSFLPRSKYAEFELPHVTLVIFNIAPGGGVQIFVCSSACFFQPVSIRFKFQWQWKQEYWKHSSQKLLACWHMLVPFGRMLRSIKRTGGALLRFHQRMEIEAHRWCFVCLMFDGTGRTRRTRYPSWDCWWGSFQYQHLRVWKFVQSIIHI